MSFPFGRLPRRTFPSAILLAGFLILVVAGNLGAQVSGSPAARHSLSLEAHSVANGGKTQVSGNSVGLPIPDAVSVQFVGDRRVSNSRTNVEINVRNFATAPDRVRVEWFFVALPVGESIAGNHEIIFHRDAQTLAIPGGKTATQVVSSPEVRAVYERSTTITNIPASVYNGGNATSTVAVTNQQRGLVIRGWMVRLVTEDGRILAAKGSSQTYEDIAASPSRLAGLLAFSEPASGAGDPTTGRHGSR